MKRTIQKMQNVLMAFLLFSLIGIPAIAQNQGQCKQTKCGAGACMGSGEFSYLTDLTEDQKAKIATLKLNLIKETTVLKNQVAEKKAHLKTISSGDNADLTAVNKTIDELFALRAEIAKKHAKYLQDVRKLLTDNQKVLFDVHSNGCCMGDKQNGCGNGSGQGQCQHQGQGQCQYQGQGQCPYQGQGQCQGKGQGQCQHHGQNAGYGYGKGCCKGTGTTTDDDKKDQKK